jgi:cytochrome c553
MKRLLLVAALCAPLGAFAESAAPAHDPIVKGDPAAGATKAAACAACHGAGGASTVTQYPKLAGQGSRFIYDQLVAFKSGVRQNPIMMPMAQGQSDQDMRDLAAFFSAQKPVPGVASKDAVATAEKIYRAGDSARDLPACAACHGPTGAGNPASGFPRVGGQHAEYAAPRLRAYRAMDAAKLPDGNLKIMAMVAARLSEKEVDALASYVNGLQ